VHESVGGLAATADDGHDAVTQSPALCSRPGGSNLTGKLQAGYVGGGIRRRWITAATLHEVGIVEPSGSNANKHLPIARFWVRTLGDDEPALGDDDRSQPVCSHAASAMQSR
jgi:hypothetical protein